MKLHSIGVISLEFFILQNDYFFKTFSLNVYKNLNCFCCENLIHVPNNKKVTFTKSKFFLFGKYIEANVGVNIGTFCILSLISFGSLLNVFLPLKSGFLISSDNFGWFCLKKFG